MQLIDSWESPNKKWRLLLYSIDGKFMLFVYEFGSFGKRKHNILVNNKTGRLWTVGKNIPRYIIQVAESMLQEARKMII